MNRLPSPTPSLAPPRPATHALLLTLLLVCLAGTAHASLVRPFEAADLADGAELIFAGTAFDEVDTPTADGGFAFRYVTFQIDQVLKGDTASDTLTLRLAGGRLGDGAVRVAGMPQFELGQRYVLFVARNGDALCPLLGWHQGQLRFSRDDGKHSAEVLTDHTGRRIDGIADGRFQRTEPTRARAELLSAEGVEITLDATKAADPAVAAEAVLAELRQLIDERRRQRGPGWVSGSQVRSADPLRDTPASLGLATGSRSRR